MKTLMAQSQGNIPIDIHYNKLSEWLVSRRHCQQQWHGDALIIREKINNAIQDMPPVDEITRLLTGTYINYFHCLRIVDLLKETEDGTKNIFGRYSSQRMKDWQEIVKLYEKDNLYLAEVSQLLTRNVNYEIPALKRQIAKCQQAQVIDVWDDSDKSPRIPHNAQHKSHDCTRKEGEYASTAAELREKFNSSCKHMGIQGKKVKTELVSLVKDLPSVYDKISHSTKELSKATDYYSTFVDFTLKKNHLGENCTPLVKFVQQKGNATSYEWNCGEAPRSVEEPKLDFHIEEEEDAEGNASKVDEIDWGNVGTDGIDFGIGVGGGETIDFGDQDAGDEGVAVDWGDGATASTIEIEVVDDGGVNVGCTEDGVARGEDALSLLDNTKTRNQFIDELMELEAFFSQRLAEIRGESNIVSSGQFQSAPAILQADTTEMEKMLSKIQDILGQLTSSHMQDLMLIRSSPRYVDRMAGKLKKILEDSEKNMSLSRLMVTRREEALEEQRLTEPKLDLIRQKTIDLKKQIEGEVSKKYHGRPVNIMGEINTV